MASSDFNWFRPGYGIIKLRNEWTVPVPFLSTEDVAQRTFSDNFSSGSGSTWKIGLYNQKIQIAIRVLHFDSTTLAKTNISDQVLVKICIINGKGNS